MNRQELNGGLLDCYHCIVGLFIQRHDELFSKTLGVTPASWGQAFQGFRLLRRPLRALTILNAGGKMKLQK